MFSLSVFIEIIRESLRFAMQGLKTNILRTILSTLGIIIGVLTIISILTFVDSLNKSVKSSLTQLGGDIIYVQKWPWLFSNDYPWWKFINRPQVSYEEMLLVRKRLKNYSAVSYIAGIYNKSISSVYEEVKNVGIDAITYDYYEVFDFEFNKGRYFSENESFIGSPKIILGNEIASSLFPDEDPIGKDVKALGKKFTVIGVLEKEGGGSITVTNVDRRAFIPINYARYLYGNKFKNMDVAIKIKGLPDSDIETLESEVRGVMRSVRKLAPGDDENFAINKASLINEKVKDIFSGLSIAGWIIAGFSILVGGIGTANIMFISVKERTFLIGIEKALGASSFFILAQFLGESIILCLFGGVIGLIFVLFGISVINAVQSDIHLVLTLRNIIIGLVLSMIIGVFSGLIPSYQASRLDPINAIRNRF